MAKIEVKFTGPARREVEGMLPASFGGQNPKQWHIDKVKEFAATNPKLLREQVAKAKIRKPAHTGGIVNPNDADHITVEYKKKDGSVIHSDPPYSGAWHVYTNRT